MRILGRRPRKPPPSHGDHQTASLELLIFLLILVCIVCYYAIQQEPTSHTIESNKNSIQSPDQFLPTAESINGTRIIWEIPSSAPKAVLFIAHGCACRPENFWAASPGCRRCVGLPEDRAIVARAVERRFAVLAASSAGECWSLGKEVVTVKRVIQWWVEKHRLGALPIAALGASSGGYFVSRLAAEMRFSAISVMIAEGVFGAMGVPAGYPPTLFVHMPKDHRRAALVERNMEFLRQKGVDVKEVRSSEFPLTPSLLSDRIPGLDPGFSARVFQLFQEKGFVDERGYMRNDGRATRWKQALKERGLQGEEFRWLDHIQEELNLAYAYHEMTSLQVDEIFEWFEAHLS